MRLQHSTWPEIEAYLSRSTGIVIPIGSTEQHGPNGPIGTDAICPEKVALEAAARRDMYETMLVGPTLSIGMAQHHMAFPGTITLRPSTLVSVVRDVVVSLARHGFDRIYFLNGHGGNIATIGAAFAEIHADRSLTPPDRAGRAVRCYLANWFMGPKVRDLSKQLYGDSEGSHATPSEVSLAWFAEPGTVREGVVLDPKVAPRGGFHDAEDYRRRFPDGRIGSDPSLSSAGHGRQLCEAAVEDLIEDWRAFLADGVRE